MSYENCNHTKNQIKTMVSAKLFETFTFEECEALYVLTNPSFRNYSKNEIIIDEGDYIDFIGIIQSGNIVSKRMDSEGNVSLQNILEPTQMFGFEIAATPTKISPLTLKCLSDSTALIFNYSDMISTEILPEKYRLKIMDNLIALLANENMRRMYKIELLCQKSLRERIMMYLRFMARKTGAEAFTIPFDRSQLAQYLNVNRSALSTELSHMKTEGLIQFDKNRFIIKNDL